MPDGQHTRVRLVLTLNSGVLLAAFLTLMAALRVDGAPLRVFSSLLGVLVFTAFEVALLRAVARDDGAMADGRP